MSIVSEVQLIRSNSVLLVLSELQDESPLEQVYAIRLSLEDVALPKSISGKTVFLCGDISKANALDLNDAEEVCIVKEISLNYSDSRWPMVGLGKVPMLVHDVGVYYRRYFEDCDDRFEQITKEHTFQSLTESRKPHSARRKGLYLTHVTEEDDGRHFHLLRCSTNLSGATKNFREVDLDIVRELNKVAARIFDQPATLNHVLAQVYHNAPATENKKQTKAKISAHADKTKDMPPNGVMAFCTFYDQMGQLEKLSNDEFDFGYKGKSGLTKLVFKLKKTVENSTLPEKFTVTLYPNSVFFMPLSTNRLYTHEIRSSILNAEMLPTRMGYVVRCSSTEAIHRNGSTFLKLSDGLVQMEAATDEGIADLRELYAKENCSDAYIDYGERFLFSMNDGDYAAPER